MDANTDRHTRGHHAGSAARSTLGCAHTAHSTTYFQRLTGGSAAGNARSHSHPHVAAALPPHLTSPHLSCAAHWIRPPHSRAALQRTLATQTAAPSPTTSSLDLVALLRSRTSACVSVDGEARVYSAAIASARVLPATRCVLPVTRDALLSAVSALCRLCLVSSLDH